MSDLMLFELTDQVDQVDVDVITEDDDSWVELRADDTASTSCRYCQTATTAAGIHNRRHGPDSTTCERMRELIRLEEETR